MNNIVLSGRNISMRYGSRVVLDNVSIDIRAGEVTALLGPNGAGKSTLLKLLCGEIPSQNDIQFFGKQKNDWEPAESAKHVAMLPQHSTLTFPFLAKEVVELGAIPLSISHKETSELALQYMAQTDVLHLADNLYPALSGGEKQRLHLARVLTQLHQSGDKKILMLDEPTSALDLAHQHNTLKIAREAAKKNNAAVVIVLHDLNLASQYADRLVLLHDGKLVCDDTPWNALTPERIEQVYGYNSIVTKHPTLDFPQVHAAA
ncbi:Part of the ABC transporter complex HmuTUV involved in hemin import. Responsible for energy coupling to the transport system [Vibrio sp. B1FIG11]|uniref:heme ABC transporter ATP-binding protein n=1 Tax=Vibrio sp. B1FIG11 TaxID=2751177 RepID=UPI001AF7D1D6|nr:heme ABC transporter ATP-binding protein [Vibrio sp. B1FIG11]CAD7821226.1 Part of the ABC transporter complex HmuTUV involved in hemin import. Responsible for energy coupling to the transport system [Vibrio sp. B1FIG11]CAE6943216.1 Part of the ABC transporter complex HmuTUV involved in hemin import. Responsible for energy coupling to the transport system [Vibrio sp. B1FIG11]